MSNLSDLLNGQPVSARQAAAAADRKGIKLPYGTIAAYWSGKHGRPSARTLEALAAVLPVPLGQLQRAAWGKESQLGEYRPPREADLLDARQRRALDDLIRSIVAAREAEHEDTNSTRPQGDPPADGEAATRRAPMKLVPAPEVEDVVEEPLPFVSAARDIDGPTDGELRRLPGKDAGEENQDPGDDWDGA